MTHRKILATASIAALLSACGGQSQDAGGQPAAGASVDLRHGSAEGGYAALDRITVPADHVIGDKTFPYEGIGWENELVGYRLYLDERLVTDVFGKTTAAPSLTRIEADTDYHAQADWGLDVLKVGPSLGIGGLGVMEGGEPRHIGKAETLTAEVEEDADGAAFTIRAEGVGQGGASVTARYTLAPNSPMTWVEVGRDGGLLLAAGIVDHGAAMLRSAEDGAWAYVATYGAQSETKDNLGLAMFYRPGDIVSTGLANQTYYVAFAAPSFRYGFLADWEQDPSGIATQDAFAAMLDARLAELNS